LPSTGTGVRRGERIGGDKQKGVETKGDRGLGGQGGDQRILAQPALEQGNGAAGDGKHGHPEQHRALVIPPGAGELVQPGLGAVTVGGDQLDRQVGSQEQPDQHQEGKGREHALCHRHRPHRANQGFPRRAKRRCAEEQLEQRQGRRQPERRQAASAIIAAFRLVQAAARELGRHVILVMLGEDLGGDEAAVGLEPPFGDDAAILAEQVRRDAGVADRMIAACRRRR
jgi:hypothetical protein